MEGREGKGKGRKEKGKEEERGRERWYPTFWCKITPKSASDMCYAVLLFTVLMNE